MAGSSKSLLPLNFDAFLTVATYYRSSGSFDLCLEGTVTASYAVHFAANIHYFLSGKVGNTTHQHAQISGRYCLQQHRTVPGAIRGTVLICGVLKT